MTAVSVGAPLVGAPPASVDPVGAERARIAAAVSRGFMAESESRRRHPHHFGLSSVGTCRRACAYALSKTPVSDVVPPEEGRAANLGTYQHAGLLPRVAAELPGAQIEVKVRLRLAGLDIPGSIDLDDPLTVIDLKTVGEHRLNGVRRVNAAYYNHRMQAGGYGLARYQEGRPPAFIGWHYLDRANGDECIVIEPFTDAFAEEVVDRVEELADWAETPDEAPRDERGPGLSIICDGCAWLRRCWGPDAEPGSTRALRVHTDPEIEQALLDYDDARAREKQAKEDKDLAVAKFDGARYGTYGRVEYGRGKDIHSGDPHASLRKLKALGLDVPQGSKRGALKVKVVKAPTDGGGK